MAGRKQHYIPRSFLRGFLSHKKKDSEYVWVFPKGRPPYNPEIRGAASERYFYSELPIANEETLDSKITDYETRFAALIEQLRQVAPGTHVDSALAAEVVAHLIIRSGGFRSAMADGLKGVLAKTFSIFGRKGALRHFAGLDKSEPDARFQELMGKIITGNGDLKKLGLPDELLLRVGFILAKEAIPRNAEIDPTLKSQLALMYGQAEPLIRELHNKALLKELIPQSRMAALMQLRWEVVSENNLILPDCVALGFQDGANPESLATMGDAFVIVAMPVTKCLLLVGKREGAPPFTPSLFNLYASACSHEYFIAATNTPELVELSKYMGGWSRKFLFEALAALEEEYSPVAHKPPEVDDNEREGLVPPGYLPSYQISFVRWPDQPDPNHIVEKVKQLTFYVADRYSLHLLDGITFSMEYENTLATMDRGYECTPIRSASLDYGVGWSVPIDVIRDGVRKIRLVFRGEAGALLLSDDVLRRALAEHMVIFQLANVAFEGMIQEAFANAAAPQSETWIASVRKELMAYAVGSYFAARESATFSPSQEKAARELLSGAVEVARRVVLEERLSYRFHGDLRSFMAKVRQQVAPILKFAAELAGFLDGLGIQDGADAELKEVLSRVNLGTWFDQFRIDLRAQFSERRRWETVEAFQEINYHAERVLWAFGVFPWTTPDGLDRIDIPLILDAARLPRATLHRPIGTLRVLLRGIKERILRRTARR